MIAKVQIGRLTFEAHRGSGGLLNVILHSAKGQQQIEITPGEWESLERIAAAGTESQREEAIAAMRVCIIYARDRRGGAFDFDTWIHLVEHALEKGQLPPHAIEEAQGEALMLRRALTAVRKERDEMQREVEELRRRQAAFVEATRG